MTMTELYKPFICNACYLVGLLVIT